jgi:D-Tyr-tRNAtyr deacylase
MVVPRAVFRAPPQAGVFGARIELELDNDGPVTIIFEVGE